MEIIVWGTAEKGKAVKKICDSRSWKIKAYVDNDEAKQGGSLDGVPILSPSDLAFLSDDDIQIWIATGAEEVYAQAKGITSNVLAWKYIQAILQSETERPPFPEVQLLEENLKGCELLNVRSNMLKKFVPASHNWKMVEIGVAFGEFSEEILKVCSPQKLYLIDCWDNERFGAGAALVKDKFQQQIAEGIVEIRQGYSTEKMAEFADKELDLAYIDTVHDYETTKKELELCAEKVKEGGYICGHDYAKYNVYSRLDYGVYDAVNEFAVNNGWEFVYLTMEKDGLQSFCLRKIGKEE